MSFIKSFKYSTPIIPTSFKSEFTFLDSCQKEVSGIIVDSQEMVTKKLCDDPRNNVSYQDLCLGNLKALGAVSQLKYCMLQRDDVDLIIDDLDNLIKLQNESVKVSSENSQTGQKS